MKRCNSCNIEVTTPATLCPLCTGPLSGPEDEKDDVRAAYPPHLINRAGFSFIKRLLLFLSVLGVLLSMVFNYIFTPHSWWWLLALTGAVYAWAVVLHAMRRGGNMAGKILMQVVCLSALTVLIDFETGYRGWSVSFMMPSIFCVGIISVILLILCNSTNWAGYVMYQVILALFGFVPLVLFFAGLARLFWPAFTPALLATISLLGLFFFGDKSVKNEFRRRLRF